MSTHNIGFYEDLTKIIFELSSNIIKYVKKMQMEWQTVKTFDQTALLGAV